LAIKRVSFQVSQELHDKFLEAIKGDFESESEAFRSFMRQKIKEKET
jgi:metal-responsive CopG/Arc/MetJ family transcriptional regulator